MGQLSPNMVKPDSDRIATRMIGTLVLVKPQPQPVLRCICCGAPAHEVRHD